METIHNTPEEKHKNGGWGTFLLMIVVVVALLIGLKMFMG